MSRTGKNMRYSALLVTMGIYLLALGPTLSRFAVAQNPSLTPQPDATIAAIPVAILERNQKLLEQPKAASKFEFPSVVPGTVKISVQGKDIENLGGPKNLEKYGRLFDAWRVLLKETGLNVKRYPDPYHHSPIGLYVEFNIQVKRLLYTDPKINFVKESGNLNNYSDDDLTIWLPNHGKNGSNVMNNYDADKPGPYAVRWEKVNIAKANFDVQCMPIYSINNGVQVGSNASRYSFYKDEKDVWNIKIGMQDDPNLTKNEAVSACVETFTSSTFLINWTVKYPRFTDYISTPEEGILYYRMTDSAFGTNYGDRRVWNEEFSKPSFKPVAKKGH